MSYLKNLLMHFMGQKNLLELLLSFRFTTLCNNYPISLEFSVLSKFKFFSLKRTSHAFYVSLNIVSIERMPNKSQCCTKKRGHFIDKYKNSESDKCKN